MTGKRFILIICIWLFIPALVLAQSATTEQIPNDAALVEFYQGNLAKAVEGFQEAIRINPRYAEAHFNLGRTFDKLGRHAEAVESFETALRINPNYSAAAQQLKKSRKRLDKKQESAAARTTRFRVSISPELSYPWEDFSPAFYDYFANRVEESKTGFKAMEQADSRDPRPFIEKGIIYYELKMYGDASYYFKVANRLAPDNQHARYNEGLALEMSGDRDGAVKLYEAVVAANPAFELAARRLNGLQSGLTADWYARAQRSYERQDWRGALESIERALIMTKPESPLYLEMKKLETLARSRVTDLDSRKRDVRQAFLAEPRTYDEVYNRGQLKYRDIQLIWTGVIFRVKREGNETVLQVMYTTDANSRIDAQDPDCLGKMFQIRCGKILDRDPRINEESFVEVYGTITGVENMLDGYRYGCNRDIPRIKANKLTISSPTYSGTLVIEPLN